MLSVVILNVAALTKECACVRAKEEMGVYNERECVYKCAFLCECVLQFVRQSVCVRERKGERENQLESIEDIYLRVRERERETESECEWEENPS
jgi:hypothetical protein